MSREEAMQEAKARIKVKIEKECGSLFLIVKFTGR